MRYSVILLAVFAQFFCREKNQEIPIAKEPAYDTIIP